MILPFPKRHHKSPLPHEEAKAMAMTMVTMMMTRRRKFHPMICDKPSTKVSREIPHLQSLSHCTQTLHTLQHTLGSAQWSTFILRLQSQSLHSTISSGSLLHSLTSLYFTSVFTVQVVSFKNYTESTIYGECETEWWVCECVSGWVSGWASEWWSGGVVIKDSPFGFER